MRFAPFQNQSIISSKANFSNSDFFSKTVSLQFGTTRRDFIKKTIKGAGSIFLLSLIPNIAKGASGDIINPLAVAKALDKMTPAEKTQLFQHARFSNFSGHTCELEKTYPIIAGQSYRNILTFMGAIKSDEGYEEGWKKIAADHKLDPNTSKLTAEQLKKISDG